MFTFRPPIKPSKVTKVIIPIIWIMAMCLHGSYFYTARLVRQYNKLYCSFSWAPEFDKQRTQERYVVVVSVFLIFLLLCVKRRHSDRKKDCDNSVSFCFVHNSSNRVSTSLLFCLGLASVMLNEQIIFSCEIYFLFQCLTKPVGLYHFK